MEDIFSQFEFDVFVDARDFFCPEPIILLHQALNQNKSGTKILLLTKDAAAPKDIERLTKFLNHKLLEQKHFKELFCFLIEKF